MLVKWIEGFASSPEERLKRRRIRSREHTYAHDTYVRREYVNRRGGLTNWC